MTTVRIYVTYKQSVFDPQAESVLNAIHPTSWVMKKSRI